MDLEKIKEQFNQIAEKYDKCSALSIHHLDDKEKLYKNIYSKLNRNGCFINLDQFIAKSEKINNMYNAWWYD